MFLDFLRANYGWIISSIVGLVSLFFIIFKKKIKVIDPTILETITLLPKWINEAENLQNPTSSSKFMFVLRRAISHIEGITGLNETEVCRKYCSTLIDSIEDILSTPQKKEVITDEAKS